LQFRGVNVRFRVCCVEPGHLVPFMAVFIEQSRLGINKAVGVNVINDIATEDLKVKAFCFHKSEISRNDLALSRDEKVRL